MAGGHAWRGGGMHGGGPAWQILRDTVNDQAVRILLECIHAFLCEYESLVSSLANYCMFFPRNIWKSITEL